MTYNLSDNLKTLIFINKTDRGELAKYVSNVSKATVSNWVNGMNKPSIDKVLLLCEYFNVSLHELVLGEIVIPNNPFHDKQMAKLHPHLLEEERKNLRFRE